MDYRLKCAGCSRYSRDRTAFRCRNCRSILEVELDYSRLSLPKGFRKERPSNAKYLPFLPADSFRVDLGEGGTPLVSKRISRYDGVRFSFKLETKNPTRSFKDRGSALEITKAVDFGYDRVVCASTGNMGMSIARYAKEAGIKATIFISANANRAKVARIRKYGADLVRVSKDFNEALRKAESFAVSESAFVCGDYHFRKEGQKTVAYEIIEQSGYVVPDMVFLPVGNATLLSGLWKGFKEWQMLGWIKKLPRIIAVQSSGCDPLVKAYNRKGKIGYVEPHTVADAIAVGYPTFGFEAIKALRESRGSAIRVQDTDIIAAVKKLGRNRIGAEPGGAAGFAGFADLYERSRRELVGKSAVIVVTGNNA